jgi:hypothetical protein
MAQGLDFYSKGHRKPSKDLYRGRTIQSTFLKDHSRSWLEIKTYFISIFSIRITNVSRRAGKLGPQVDPPKGFLEGMKDCPGFGSAFYLISPLISQWLFPLGVFATGVILGLVKRKGKGWRGKERAQDL